MIVALYSLKKDALLEDLVSHIAITERRQKICEILDMFGPTLGNNYLLLRNDYWDGNAYFQVSIAIDEYFGVEGTDAIIRKNRKALDVYGNSDDVLYKLKGGKS